MNWHKDEQEDEQDKEFVALLRQFRPVTPRSLTTVRAEATRWIAIAATVLLACAIPLRFFWTHTGSDAQRITATGGNRPLAPSTAPQIAIGQVPARARQDNSALGRSLQFIPSVEATLSASAPPATPQDRVEVTLPGARSFAVTRLGPPPRKVIARIKPMYPPEAERLGLEAYVVLKLTVNRAGEVTNTERINGVVNLRPDEPNASARADFYAANPYAFTVASESAAKQWKFEAAGSSMTCFVAFTFHLAPETDPARSTAARSASTLSAVPGSSRPGFPVPSQPPRVDGRLIKSPTRLVNVNPVYPDEARAAHVSGVVILEITIAEDGSVSGARVLRSIPMLDQAAIDAVRQWVYEPTLLNGVPIAVTLTVTINFTLQ